MLAHHSSSLLCRAAKPAWVDWRWMCVWGHQQLTTLCVTELKASVSRQKPILLMASQMLTQTFTNIQWTDFLVNASGMLSKQQSVRARFTWKTREKSCHVFVQDCTHNLHVICVWFSPAHANDTVCYLGCFLGSFKGNLEIQQAYYYYKIIKLSYEKIRIK